MYNPAIIGLAIWFAIVLLHAIHRMGTEISELTEDNREWHKSYKDLFQRFEDRGNEVLDAKEQFVFLKMKYDKIVKTVAPGHIHIERQTYEILTLENQKIISHVDRYRYKELSEIVEHWVNGMTHEIVREMVKKRLVEVVIDNMDEPWSRKITVKLLTLNKTY